ncbi:hypothetical protein PIIN_02911 [Serendipita indica DSM 11827]|uniref:Uncharacterized protein n=1 Tax=Serendipita indica (strain DSM 11827) TaxID=1109443 RepID=G4TCJ4_SERID|nr:hypothetical protein PIIN_02911 [Serendipita indica DSM 11827]
MSAASQTQGGDTSINDMSTSGVSVLSPSQVIDSLEKAVENAKIRGDLKSYESFVEDVVDAGIKYQIRLCPALAQKHKERAPTPNIAPDASNITAVVQTITQTDPFLPPFNSLHIGEMRDVLEEDSVEGYNVLLNKFALVKGHFLLVTKEYESQAHPLTPSQLVQTYLLLLAAHTRNRPFFAFFNCGILSGASQPHKHIQFFPGQAPIERLAKAAKVENEARPFALPQLPFAAHIKRLDKNVLSAAEALVDGSSTAESSDEAREAVDRLSAELAMSFMAILDEMYQTIRVHAHHSTTDTNSSAGNGANLEVASAFEGGGPSTPSYNVVMTLEHIYLFPRTAEKYTPTSSSSNLTLSINSLGFAGMLLVKSEEERALVKEIGITSILRRVGMEPLKEEDNKGCDDVFADLA